MEIFPRLLEDCRVAESRPDKGVDARVDAKAIFSSLDYSDNWDDADLRSCIKYIRGSLHLRIPSDWREHLPVRF